MISDNPRITDPAMHVIRRIDPAIAAEMEASDWRVFAARSPADLPPESDAAYALASEFASGAVAVTMAEGTPYGYGRTTWLNMPLLNAAFTGRTPRPPVADYIATTMVHEFTHYKLGYAAGEKPAYKADIAFALKLPARRDAVIVEDSEKGLADYS
jgi:hypothetical protein